MYEIYISNVNVNLYNTTNLSLIDNGSITVGKTGKVLIHSDIVPSEDTKITEGKLAMADNAAGSLDITLPPNNAGYDMLVPLMTEVVVRKETDGWIRIDFIPSDMLAFALPKDIEERTYYKYRRWGNSIQVKAWSCGKCFNEDVSFLIHRRFTSKGTKLD